LTAAQMIGYSLLQTTAITAIVGAGTAGRVYSGLRPALSTVPCINYFKLSGQRRNGIEREDYSVNCRDSTVNGAMNLAKLVKDLWAGSEGMTTYGTWNGFDVMRASVTDQGVIPEPEDGLYNAVLDIQIVYRVETVT
jgi:hypothetical protein